jgi:hypothetical protein
VYQTGAQTPAAARVELAETEVRWLPEAPAGSNPHLT